MVGTMSMPDAVLAEAMKQFTRIALALKTDDDRELALRMQELEGFFRVGPPLSDALKRMVIDARPSQMKSIIRGYLVNYVYEW
jgi:hypothetical protein